MIISLVELGKENIDFVKQKTGEDILVFKSPKEAEGLLPRAEILISWGGFDSGLLKYCGSLKWLFITSAGVEKLPFSQLSERGVMVTNVSGIHGTQIAEHVLGMMLAFSRGLHLSLRGQLQRKWRSYGSLSELAGKNLCIVGAGRIGREVARKAKAFDLSVTGIKKHAEPLDYFDEVLGMDRLHEALEQADYTLLLTPLTSETFHLIGSKEFDAMKPDSIFINMSRGDTVDEEAMIMALKQGRIAGAGLDVFHKEPLPESSPLWDMENVIITPHNAGVSPYYTERAMELFAQSLVLYRRGEPMPNRIDFERQY